MKAVGLGLVALLVAVVAWVVVGLVAYALLVPAAKEPAAERVDPTTPRLTIVAMGDSYMSGEGAGRFYRGTDRPGVDSCRRAPTAYPPRMADALHARLYFVACSGARTYNVGSRFSVPGVVPVAQYPGSPVQIETLKAHPEADVVLLSIGGNDALFSEIVALCAGRGDSCVPKATPWMDNLDAVVQPSLRDVYTEVRQVAPAARIYVTTYPSPFTDDLKSCRAVGMDTDEVGFVRTFITRLNDQIALAARFAGVGVIDLSSTLQKEGLCAGAGAGSTFNGWREQKPDGFPREPIDPLRGSFHPTEHGHARIAAEILDPHAPPPTGPRPEPARPPCGGGRAAPPADNPPTPPSGGPANAPPGAPVAPLVGPPDAPPAGPPGAPDDRADELPPTLPPYVPDEFGEPLPPFGQDCNPCTPTASQREVVEHDAATHRVTGAKPRTPVCFRTLHGDWHTTRADRRGRATVRFSRVATAGIGGYRRILFRHPDGEWVMRILRPSAQAAPPDVSMPKAWITSRDAPLLIGIVAAFLATWAGAWVATRTVADRYS